MKSLNTTLAYTEACTPHQLLTESDQNSQTVINTFAGTLPKMLEFMNSSIENTSQLKLLSRTTSLPKHTKPRISIMRLTREKVRVGRAWKRSGQRGTADGILSNRFSPLSKQQIQSNSSKKYKQFFTMMSFMYNKSRKGNYKLEVLIDELTTYFGRRKEQQYLREVEQISRFASLIRTGLIQDTAVLRYDIIKNCQWELSKLFFNICYEIYLHKKNQFTLRQLNILHRDIEYYSRRLGMLTLTLVTCLDMGRAYLDFFEFEKAEEQYTKSVKLSVFIGDKYREQLAIDRLGMCQYYRGDMMAAYFYHSSMDRLSNYNKLRIRQHYSNEGQIQKILQQKTKQKSIEQQVKQQFFRQNKQNIEFNFDFMTKDTEYTQNNLASFRNDLKQMIKVQSLRRKVPAIKTAMEKVRKIGEKKYKGKEYLVPKASKFYQRSGDKSQDEFMQSHKSYNRNNVTYESIKINKHCKIIDQIMNFFLSESKFISKAIIEERQSIISDEH